jgi:branched-chain amino acid transport system permease protein
MELFLQALVSGLLMGGIYALVAIGLTLIYGVMDIVNFAHGSFLMVGMYFTYWMFVLFNIDPYLSLGGGIVIFFLLGVGIQKLLIKPVINSPHHIQILLTIGLFLVMDNLALLFFSPDFRTIKVAYADASWELGSTLVSIPRFIAFLGAFLMTGALYFFLKKTDIGKAIRGSSEEKIGARLVGINVNLINMIAFGLGTASVGIAGSMLTPFFYVAPDVGFSFVLKTFVIVVMGGMGNFFGAMICALIVGLSESLGAILLSGSSKDILTYVIFILVLLLRPQGIFTKKSES